MSLVGGSAPGEGNVMLGGRPVCDDAWDAEAWLDIFPETNIVVMVAVTAKNEIGVQNAVVVKKEVVDNTS